MILMSVSKVQLRYLVYSGLFAIFVIVALVISRNYALILASKMSAPELVAPIDLAYEFTEQSSINLAHVAFSIDIHSNILTTGTIAQASPVLFGDQHASPQLALATHVISISNL